MRAIETIIEMLSVSRKEIMDKGMKYPGATDMVLCLAKMEDEARRLAAEEKSGDEELIISIPKDKRCPYRFGINITTGGCDGVIEGPAEVIVRSPRHPTPKESPEGLRDILKSELLAVRKNKIGPDVSGFKYWNGCEQELIRVAERMGLKCDNCHGSGMVGGGSDGLDYCPKCDMGLVHPAPDRTGELVKRLRELCEVGECKDRCPLTVCKITEILRDYEGGA